MKWKKEHVHKSVACGPMGEGCEECSQEGGTVRRGKGRNLQMFARKLLEGDVYFHCLHCGDGFMGINMSKYI